MKAVSLTIEIEKCKARQTEIYALIGGYKGEIPTDFETYLYDKADEIKKEIAKLEKKLTNLLK